MRTLVVLSLLVLAPEALVAHPGGLAADGCHNDRKNGGRHCHRSSSTRSTRPSTSRGLEPLKSRSGGAYVNCSAARAAGAAPVRVGNPGYGEHLDRDGDGVGCE